MNVNLKFATLLGIMVPVVVAFASFCRANDWSNFGGPNRDFTFDDQSIDNSHIPTKRWQRTLGQGMAGLIVEQETAYTSFLAPFADDDSKKPEHKRKHREVVIALNADNGETVWRHEYDAGWIEEQQAFGGRSRAPQATPTICGKYLVSVDLPESSIALTNKMAK